MDYKFVLLFLALSVSVATSLTETAGYDGIVREVCGYRWGKPFQPHSPYRQRVADLRNQMRIRASVQGPEIDAYIITTYDEHQSDETAESDRRLQYISGFTGPSAEVAITMKNAAIWMDRRFLAQANAEMNCDWKIFRDNKFPSITDWLINELPHHSRVGIDPHMLPHFVYKAWEEELKKKFIQLVKIKRHLVDFIWPKESRPRVKDYEIRIQPLQFAGETWQSKIDRLRSELSETRIDAIIVTSLTEIAYVLNLRGHDIPYTPVFKAYLIVTMDEIFLYTNPEQVTTSVILHLDAQPCIKMKCVKIKHYDDIWDDIRTYVQVWKKVIVPSHCVFDMGASEAIYSHLPKDFIVHKPSPIIFMRTQKNDVERQGMHNAHIRDGAAMCEALSYIEGRYKIRNIENELWTEEKVAEAIDRARLSQNLNYGQSFKTVAAFGPHGALPYYEIKNATNHEIFDNSTLVITSGGQYLDGTTEVTRTIHLGEPTYEEKIAYTNVLSGIIRLSKSSFPENLNPSDLDTLIRGAIWSQFNDYPHGTGHGIGSYLSVHESPINVAYTTKQTHLLKDGQFISSEPAYYKGGNFGVRLENVFEVYNTGKKHGSGFNFLGFRDVTLVPFEPKLIERSILSAPEKRWLNEYNAHIRELVGKELKDQKKIEAFYWMMNKTAHVLEYLPASDYRKSNSGPLVNSANILLMAATCYQLIMILLNVLT